MKTVPFALYDAFTDVPFGGSQAGVVSDAAFLDAELRRKIAREIGAPATSFVSEHDNSSVTARFNSTVMELPMCGHGTMCLMTRMVELDLLEPGSETLEVELRLPTTSARVEITLRDDGRPVVMLDIRPATFRTDDLDRDELAGFLGLGSPDLGPTHPLETAVGDFIHLVVPVNDLETIRRIQPDFSELTRFCKQNAIETVAVFTDQVEQPGYTIHVRDFCPAVGVAESAAAGTTNAALSAYLIRHDMVKANADGIITVLAEQGHEIDRPSTIRSIISVSSGVIDRLQVGGVASKVVEGRLHLPE